MTDLYYFSQSVVPNELLDKKNTGKFLSSPIECVAFERLELLGTEIHGRWSSSKLFLELFSFCVTLVPMVCIPMVCIPGVYWEYTGSIPGV